MSSRGFAVRVGSVVVALVAASHVALSVSGQEGAVFRDDPAAALFRAARMAVGHGEGKLLALKSLVLKGESRVAMEGQPPVDAAVEIRVLLPDHYLRVDVAPASRMITGFAGKTLLTAIDEGGRLTEPPANLRDGLLKHEQARLARLLLGMAAYVSPSYFVTFRSIGTPGQAALAGSASYSTRVGGGPDTNGLEGAGRNGFFIRMFVDGASRPVSLQYRTVREEMNTMSFADRRDVDGLQLPFRITTTQAGRTIDDITLSQILVNSPLGDADFVVKSSR